MPEFTNNWFSRNRRDFHKHILPVWAGKPCSYLEIGVYEGASLAWMLRSVLTHPDSRAIGVDPWAPMDKNHTAEQMEAVYQLARSNLAEWMIPRVGRIVPCCLFQSTSTEFFQTHSRLVGVGRFYDIAYIDGCHDPGAVTADAVAVERLMKPGGWIIFDDVRTVRPNQVLDGIKAWLRSSPAHLAWQGGYCDCYQV